MFKKYLDKKTNSGLVMCEPQVFGLWVGSSLPFLRFRASGVFGWCKICFRQVGGQAGIYVHTGSKLLGGFIA